MQQGKSYADEHQLLFQETSAKEDTNVRELFELIGLHCILNLHIMCICVYSKRCRHHVVRSRLLQWCIRNNYSMNLRPMYLLWLYISIGSITMIIMHALQQGISPPSTCPRPPTHRWPPTSPRMTHPRVASVLMHMFTSVVIWMLLRVKCRHIRLHLNVIILLITCNLGRKAPIYVV